MCLTIVYLPRAKVFGFKVDKTRLRVLCYRKGDLFIVAKLL